MGRHIQNDGLYPILGQILGNLQADITGADNHSPFHLSGGELLPQGNGILRSPHKKDVFQIHSVDGGPDGTGACGNHQLVIRINGFLPGVQIDSRHLFCSTVHMNGFCAGQDLCSGEALVFLRRIDNQSFFVLNDMAHIVR